jgi:hypothetical protein
VKAGSRANLQAVHDGFFHDYNHQPQAAHYMQSGVAERDVT